MRNYLSIFEDCLIRFALHQEQLAPVAPKPKITSLLGRSLGEQRFSFGEMPLMRVDIAYENLGVDIVGSDLQRRQQKRFCLMQSLRFTMQFHRDPSQFDVPRIELGILANY